MMTRNKERQSIFRQNINISRDISQEQIKYRFRIQIKEWAFRYRTFHIKGIFRVPAQIEVMTLLISPSASASRASPHDFVAAEEPAVLSVRQVDRFGPYPGRYRLWTGSGNILTLRIIVIAG